MIAIKQNDTSLTNLLDSFSTGDPVVNVNAVPNIKMSIDSSQTKKSENKNKRVLKTVKCRGKLVNRGGKLVPDVVCSSDNIQLPVVKKQQNRDNLMKVILGEVRKSKEEENETMPFPEGSHPLMGMKPKKSCGCSKKFKISKNPPEQLFPELSENNNLNNNNTVTKSKGTKKRGKKAKRKYKTVQLSLDGRKPKIPTVNVVRKKKRASRKKKNKKASKNQN